MKKLEDYILSIPDFPEKGIIFRDITTVVQDPDGLQTAINTLASFVDADDVDVVVGPEARGFIFGVPLAYKLKKGFVPIRKKGKLPRETISVSYALEYGSAEIEIHKDAITPGQRVVLVDASSGDRRNDGSQYPSCGAAWRKSCQNSLFD